MNNCNNEPKLGLEKLPNIFDETIFNELLILVLVEAHKNGVIPSLRPRFEVERHLLLPKKKNNKFQRENSRVSIFFLVSFVLVVFGGTFPFIFYFFLFAVGPEQ